MSSTVIERSAHVPYDTRAMYDLVADIDSYPHFLPWCRGAAVRSRSESEITATLRIARGPLRISFTTRNLLHPPERIDLQLVEGPFRKLDGAWRFIPLDGEGCKVSLHLGFEFSSGLIRATVAPVFREIADTMLDAFCARAHQVYGGR